MSALAAVAPPIVGFVAVCTGLALVAGAVFVRAAFGARVCEEAHRAAAVSESRIVDLSVGFATAACESVTAVRTALAGALCAAVPDADGVLVYEEHDGALVCTAAFGERFTYYRGTTFALNDANALPVQAIVAGHRIRLGEGARAIHPSDADAIAVPLALGSGRRSAVAVAARTPFGAAAVARIVTLCELAAPAYRIALEREDDRHRAEYDGLTGLLTPRAFRQRLGVLVDRTRHVSGGSLALLFVDTDHFKRWNDTCGHAAGDVLLRAIAGVLRGFATDRDLVARNGGDEFCLVFADTGKASAIERADSLRAQISAVSSDVADTSARRPHGAADRITASIGVAAFPADAATTNELLERADAAMYHSKETGRDGVSYDAGDGRFVRYAAGCAPARIPAAVNRSPHAMLPDRPPL